MQKKQPKIFLSYAREDMGMAKQLFNDLQHYGLDAWLAPSRTGIRSRCCLGIDGRIELRKVIFTLQRKLQKNILELY